MHLHVGRTHVTDNLVTRLGLSVSDCGISASQPLLQASILAQRMQCQHYGKGKFLPPVDLVKATATLPSVHNVAAVRII